MTCKDCKIRETRTLPGDGNSYRALSRPLYVELCPVHALTERLAEALRSGIPGWIPQNWHEEATKLLAEYDSAKHPPQKRRD